MAYFGNTPLQSTYLTDYLSGDNSTVAFTLARAPISAQSVLVHISGVKQHASTYGVAGTTLTFSEAPPTGTNNIEVLHLGISPETVTLPSYRTITEFTATAGQTTFSPASYTVGYIDVFRNGVKLGTADFTASNGTTVVLTVGCTDGDLVRFEGFLITAFNDAIPNTAGAVGSSLIADGSITNAKLVAGAAVANIGARAITAAQVPAGSVIQVVQTNFTAATSFSGTTFQTITGLTTAITPISTSSKILIMVNISQGETQDTFPAYLIKRNGTTVSIADDGTQTECTFAGVNTGANTRDQYLISPINFQFLDSPNTASAISYTIEVSPMRNVSRVVFINRSESLGDANQLRATSTLILMEIAG